MKATGFELCQKDAAGEGCGRGAGSKDTRWVLESIVHVQGGAMQSSSEAPQVLHENAALGICPDKGKKGAKQEVKRAWAAGRSLCPVLGPLPKPEEPEPRE